MSKKNICFISLGNLYLCPYIFKYISLLDDDFDYDVIYWNRHAEKEDIGAKNTFSFEYQMNDNESKIKKIKGYLKFKKYILKILKKRHYDSIVLLQTSVGILLRSFLKKEYKEKYIVDIRDYTLEKKLIFYLLLKDLINNSAYTVISSRGYENFLPKHDYILVHNDTFIDKEIIEKFKKRKKNKEKIIISYIGLIRFNEQNKKNILKFKNDDRFLLKFIGTNALELKQFCDINNIENVELIDKFPPSKTLDYYYETDIIYNLYGNNTPLLDYALSNKLYYAAKLNIPILVCPNTYMEKVVLEYGLGYVFDSNNVNECDNLFNYYKNINWDIFSKNCNNFLEKVENDNMIFNSTIGNFFKQI
mgnify:FL=1